MLEIQENYSLINNNTFGVDIACSRFAQPKSIEELTFVINYGIERSLKTLVIGEGSNLLFRAFFDGLVIHPRIKGIEQLDESETEILIRVGAGENWDNFVEGCVDRNWYGTENLSLIPGSVGATAVQNIGAYGVEAKDIIEYVEVIDISTMKPKILSSAACEFGYRDSVFKHGPTDRYIVTHVIFRLLKNGILNLNYGNVKEEFMKSSGKSLTDLRNTIISIRRSKLPDYQKYGNAGSYFKNPVLSMDHLHILQESFENIPNFPAGSSKVKIPAAWLIEHAGYKGIREGDTGTWPDQPLVIVNYGHATGDEIFNFSEKIRQSIIDKFDIQLEREVSVVE